MPAIRRHDAARADLIDHYVYLAEKAGEELADRFMDSAEATFNFLLTQPLIGSPVSSQHPALANLRKWSITNFENFLIFYLPQPDGIAIVRVLYGARDWWSVLDLEK